MSKKQSITKQLQRRKSKSHCKVPALYQWHPRRSEMASSRPGLSRALNAALHPHVAFTGKAAERTVKCLHCALCCSCPLHPAMHILDLALASASPLCYAEEIKTEVNTSSEKVWRTCWKTIQTTVDKIMISTEKPESQVTHLYPDASVCFTTPK